MCSAQAITACRTLSPGIRAVVATVWLQKHTHLKLTFWSGNERFELEMLQDSSQTQLKVCNVASSFRQIPSRCLKSVNNHFHQFFYSLIIHPIDATLSQVLTASLNKSQKWTSQHLSDIWITNFQGIVKFPDTKTDNTPISTPLTPESTIGRNLKISPAISHW